MDGAELEFVCFCGGRENFERVIVQRKPHPPIVTDFVACVACKGSGLAIGAAWRVLGVQSHWRLFGSVAAYPRVL